MRGYEKERGRKEGKRGGGRGRGGVEGKEGRLECMCKESWMAEEKKGDARVRAIFIVDRLKVKKRRQALDCIRTKERTAAN